MFFPLIFVLFWIKSFADQIDLPSDQDVHIEVLKMPEHCERKANSNDFVTLHFKSEWDDSTQIASTYERGVPIEIQIGTKMISPGLDDGLKDICVGETRKITLPAELGSPDDTNDSDLNSKKIIYEVEVISISDQTTGNTFRYLDLNGDNKISEDEAESLVKMFMKALSTDLSGVDVKYLISFFMSMHDRDGDSFISEEEFLDSVNSLTGTQDHDEL